MSIADIYHRLGYRSAAAFHRAFKNRHRAAPSEYRRQSAGLGREVSRRA